VILQYHFQHFITYNRVSQPYEVSNFVDLLPKILSTL